MIEVDVKTELLDKNILETEKRAPKRARGGHHNKVEETYSMLNASKRIRLDQEKTAKVMNLNSLPEELLARVLKRTNYPTLVKLRKMDSRIDVIAKKFVGTRLPVQNLTILFYDDGCSPFLKFDPQTECFFAPFLQEKKHYGTIGLDFDIDTTYSFEKFQSFLDKIQVKNELSVESHTNSLTEDMIKAVFSQIRPLREIRHLNIFSGYIMPRGSKESIQKFIASSPNLQELNVHWRGASDLLCNEEILGGRPWKFIKFPLRTSQPVNPFPQLADMNWNFLHKVVKNCEKFEYIGPLTQFTFNEFLDFIEGCLQDKNFFTKQKWNFNNIPAFPAPHEKIINRLNEMENIQYFWRGELYDEKFCQIKLVEHPEVSIGFTIFTEGRERRERETYEMNKQRK